MRQLNRINQLSIKIATVNPWTNVYGIARTLLALGTLSTLLFNNIYNLYPNRIDINLYPTSIGITKYSLFALLGAEHLELTKWICVLVLVVVCSGWRPRYTGVFHWYVTASFFLSSPVVDGGDQLSSILTLLLIPFCLTDNRKWHWNYKLTNDVNDKNLFSSLLVWTTWWIIRIQMAVVYFHAAVGKFDSVEWMDGTSLYYWFNNSTFGMPPWIKPIVDPFLANPITVTLMTWSVLFLEILLFASFFMEKSKWRFFLKFGIAFHFTIILVHGLVSFFFAITAGLILYLRPIDAEFNFKSKKVVK